MSDLLFEIGTEELPAGFILPASNQLAALFKEKTEKCGLASHAIKRFATPRRLGITVNGLADRQADITEVLLGPSRQAAFDAQGNPTKAAQGFARSKGVSIDELELVQTERGEYLQLTRTVEGRDTVELLPIILGEIVLELSFAKSMRWGTNKNTFARPIQWITALFGTQTVVFEHEGIVSGNKTCGHRFMAPGFVKVPGVDLYEQTLEQLQVIGSFKKRRQHVLKEIEAAVGQTDFGVAAKVAVHEGLLDTVTNLVEYPFGVCGRFDEKFLQLPGEVLITSMREHQKYFPVVADDGSLLPGFVAVNNTRVIKPELTREGHQRVLRARLEDAFFFFESDKKKKLDDRVADLGGIIFQAKLGSMLDKSERIVKLTRLLTEILEPEIVEAACRAARLCKADLTSNMVGEFPSLQGVMGSAYAAHDGESEAVAAGIQEHYMPLRSDAELPVSTIGALVGMADRIDTIAGCFGIAQVPTGTADPFGLRRLSLALLHIIEDRGYFLELPSVFSKALALYGDRVNGSAQTVEQIIAFLRKRFVNDCVHEGMDPRAVEAVTSIRFIDTNDCLKRIAAFTEIREAQSFDMLAGSFKRIRNIIKDNDDNAVNPELLSEAAEKELYSVYQSLEEACVVKLADGDYLGFLEEMLRLKDPVDRFFDDVMVMAEDQAVRKNRLNLLTAINQLITQVGDISRMHSA